jgi:DNA-binding NtrC family response regulator
LIHANSPRRAKPFVLIDCPTISDTLWDSECFGSVKGRFTGAQHRPGWFRPTDGGALFINELQDVSRPLQAKLKEFLQSKRIRPVGADRAIEVDARLIVATNRDLEQMVREGNLASDLLARLGCNVIQIPPLRERREDIPALVDHFLEPMSRQDAGSTKGLTAEAQQVLRQQPWPGNVRQLQKVVEAAWLRSRGPTIDAADVIEALHPWNGQGQTVGANHDHLGTLCVSSRSKAGNEPLKPRSVKPSQHC